MEAILFLILKLPKISDDVEVKALNIMVLGSMPQLKARNIMAPLGDVPKVLLFSAGGNPESAESELISTGVFTDRDIDLLDTKVTPLLSELTPYDDVVA